MIVSAIRAYIRIYMALRKSRTPLIFNTWLNTGLADSAPMGAWQPWGFRVISFRDRMIFSY